MEGKHRFNLDSKLTEGNLLNRNSTLHCLANNTASPNSFFDYIIFPPISKEL